MRIRTAKKIATRIEADAQQRANRGETHDIRAITMYRRAQIWAVVLRLRRRFLRGVTACGSYTFSANRSGDLYFLANRMESIAVRLKFFTWAGRGRLRVHRPVSNERRGSRRYYGEPYSPKGKLMRRKGVLA